MQKIKAPISWTKHLLPMHPVVYITTVSYIGVDNGAVFATCMDTSYNPPQITFASAIHQHKVIDNNKAGENCTRTPPTFQAFQDTFRNIRDTRKFIVNVPGIELAWAMKELAFPYDYGVDEIEKAGLTKLPPFNLADRIASPKIIGECLAHLECRLVAFFEPPKSDHVFITGNVVGASYEQNLGDNLKDIRSNLARQVFGQLGASEKPSERYIGTIQITELADTLVFEAERS